MPLIKKRSYGMVAFAVDREGKRRYLILRAFRNWDFPKGAIEEDESPLMAAERELREETGIADFALPYGNLSKDTEPYAGGKVATFFIARVEQQPLTLPVSEELGKPEHDEYRWATEAEARRLLPPRLVAVLEWAIGVIGGSKA